MKVILFLVPALDPEMVRDYAESHFFKDHFSADMTCPFPSLPAPFLASLRTNADPSSHGIFSGLSFDEKKGGVRRLSPSSKEVCTPVIWEDFRRNGGKVAQIGLPQSAGLESDLFVTPFYDGEKTSFLYDAGIPARGKDETVCQWLANCTEKVISKFKHEQNALILVNLPGLDDAAAEFGKKHGRTGKAFSQVETALVRLSSAAETSGFQWIYAGYAPYEDVRNTVRPNLLLREAGWLEVSRNPCLPLPQVSRAFAVTDHQTAFVHVRHKEDLDDLKMLFGTVKGIGAVMERALLPELDSPDCGELVLEAEEGFRFSSKWFTGETCPVSGGLLNGIGIDPDELCRTKRLFPGAETGFLPDERCRASCGREGVSVCGASFELPVSREGEFTAGDLAGIIENLLKGQL